MIITKMASLCRIGKRTGSIICSNQFHTSPSCHLDQRWRQLKKLPSNPIRYGPLTNDPDYTFKDGRCTPYGTRYVRRVQEQREYAERIVKLVGQVDHAVERHARMQIEAKENREKLLNSKLKPKGKLYKPLNES